MYIYYEEGDMQSGGSWLQENTRAESGEFMWGEDEMPRDGLGLT